MIASNLFDPDTDCKVKKRVIIFSQKMAHLFLIIPLQTTVSVNFLIQSYDLIPTTLFNLLFRA